MSRIVLLKRSRGGGWKASRKPARDRSICATCGYPLATSDEDGCKSCDADLCGMCFRQEPYGPDCPSEPEEHGSDWWRALLEAGFE